MTADISFNNTLANQQSVTTSGAAQEGLETNAQRAQLNQDFDDFLVLLTTQLQNQDPLDPMDSKEFTNQLVQFSQVEQQINTNQKLDDMLQLDLASISSVALGYVGLDVNYISQEASFDGETPINISYSLAEQATAATLNILDENGNVVYSEQAPTAAGVSKITWDGSVDGSDLPAEEGTYSVRIDALDTQGNSLEATTVVSGNVRGIESQDGVIFLLIGERAVPLSSVLNASIPEEQETAGNDDPEGDSEEGESA